jgi:ubiquinone/menaquinone biosynthesis C-methylase UbiE
MDSDLSQQWDKSSERIPADKEPSAYAAFVAQKIPEHARIVDLCGGKGEDASYFLQHGHRVHIIDISPKALEAAVQRAERIGLAAQLTVTAADIYAGVLSVENDVAEVVYSRLGFHYGMPDQTAAALKEVERILTSEGKAYIVVKSSEDTEEMGYLKESAEEVAPNVFRDGVGLKSRFSREQWGSILREAGIHDYELTTYTEDLSGKNDVTKSGNLQQLLTQITFSKQIPQA